MSRDKNPNAGHETGAGQKFRRITAGCLAVYLVLLIRMIVFKNPWEETMLVTDGWSWEAVRSHMETANFVPFHTINLYITYWEKLGRIAFVNLVYNVIAFIPFGLAVPIVRGADRVSFWFTMITGFLLSAGIELTQLITLLGECDVDDVILNTAGVFLGWLIYAVCYVISRIVRFISGKISGR